MVWFSVLQMTDLGVEKLALRSVSLKELHLTNCSNLTDASLRVISQVRQWGQNILYFKYYTLFWQSVRLILNLYFFSVRYFKNTLFYRIKLSQRIKSTLFILFSLNIWYMSAVYRPMSISKKNLLAASALAQATHIFLIPYLSKFVIFLAKNGINYHYCHDSVDSYIK